MDVELKKHPWCVSQMQVVQVSATHIRVKIVKGPEFDQRVIDRMLTLIRRGLDGEGVTVDHEYAPSIPRALTEKRKFIVSSSPQTQRA